MEPENILDYPLVKRSVTLHRHRTSVSVELPFWIILKASAGRMGMSLNKLIAGIDRHRTGNLSSALRLYALNEAARRQ